MPGWKRIAAALIVLAPEAPAAAQDPSDLARQIINDPSNPQVAGAKAALRDDPKVQGGKALRITIKGKGANPWDASVGGPIAKPVKAGDKLILAFWARLEKGENGAATATLPYDAIQLATAPYSTVVSGSNQIGPEWKLQQVAGKADRDYPAGTLKVTIQLATAKQTVDVGPIIVLDTGQ
ncbi:hypothetical protein [Sphingomonas sp.]|uniref:hypothetical protein n=1 Tax=Sphingomonas sp. TaxID=28214 RepID=UPI0038A30CCD